MNEAIPPKRPAIFLDRDGTINVEKHYLYKLEDWEWIPGAIETIGEFNKAGYSVVIVSNQAGIARGYYGEVDLQRLNQFIQKELAKTGAQVDRFYHCPHHPEFTGECDCRKPKCGMLLRATLELNLDLTRSWLIGDKLTDIQAARAAGVKAVMVRTGYGVYDGKKLGNNTLIFNTISEAGKHICA